MSKINLKGLWILCFLLAMSFVDNTAHARGEFTKGRQLVNANLGLKMYVVPHFSLSYEYCVASNLFGSNFSLGVGGYVGTTFGALHAFNTRVALHKHVGKTDYYGGVLNGLNIWYTRAALINDYKASWNPHYGFDVFFGWRRTFSEHWSLNFELAPIPFFLFTQPYWSVGTTYLF